MRFRHDPKIDRLAVLPTFARCSRETLTNVAVLLDEVTFAPGEPMVSQGKSGSAFYLIETGIADVSVDGRHVCTLGPGDGVGETAMLDHLPRTATVTARGEVTAFVASVPAFQTLISDHAVVAASLLRQMAGRMRIATESMRR